MIPWKLYHILETLPYPRNVTISWKLYHILVRFLLCIVVAIVGKRHPVFEFSCDYVCIFIYHTPSTHNLTICNEETIYLNKIYTKYRQIFYYILIQFEIIFVKVLLTIQFPGSSSGRIVFIFIMMTWRKWRKLCLLPRHLLVEKAKTGWCVDQSKTIVRAKWWAASVPVCHLPVCCSVPPTHAQSFSDDCLAGWPHWLATITIRITGKGTSITSIASITRYHWHHHQYQMKTPTLSHLYKSVGQENFLFHPPTKKCNFLSPPNCPIPNNFFNKKNLVAPTAHTHSLVIVAQLARLESGQKPTSSWSFQIFYFLISFLNHTEKGHWKHSATSKWMAMSERVGRWKEDALWSTLIAIWVLLVSSGWRFNTVTL